MQELAKNGTVVYGSISSLMYGGAVGVRFDVRKLNVGDFLWIAKEKTSPLPGQCVCVFD